jgi:branched-chain amino acid transport system substrate-binding protein
MLGWGFVEGRKMRRCFFAAVVAAFGLWATDAAIAQDTLKIGLIMPITGVLAPLGKQVTAAAKLYVAQHGTTVAGKKIELIIKDDSGVPDNARRLAQELVVNDHVSVIGAGVAPSALAVAPIVTQGKVATVIMIAGTSIVIGRSPYFVRTSFTLGQSSSIIGEWAAKNGSSKVVIIHSDYPAGPEASAVFTAAFTKAGGQIAETLKVPVSNPDFAPALERARDLKPDTLFVFVPASGQAGTFAKQFVERGFVKAGIKLIGPGDITDDDDLPAMSDAMLGVVTAGNYSADHQSAMNTKYVEDFKKAYNLRPNFISVGGWDGMHAIYEALEKTGGRTDGDLLIEAMKGMSWESPRGPISIDPQTREIVQNIYIRKVEKKNGELYNVEFATFEAVKDPGKLH